MYNFGSQTDAALPFSSVYKSPPCCSFIPQINYKLGMSCCREPLPGEEVSTELPGNHRKLLKASCCFILIHVQHSPKTPPNTLTTTFVSSPTLSRCSVTAEWTLCYKMVVVRSYKSCSPTLQPHSQLICQDTIYNFFCRPLICSHLHMSYQVHITCL